MIAYIEGRFLERTENSVLVLTEGGVGYEVYVPQQVFSTLPAKGQRVEYFIDHIVREDAAELFGFPTFDERRMFRVLTSINRVGARTALGILSVFSPQELRQLVADNDSMALAQVSGIGKKTAQQIFLDLQYKLKGSGDLDINLNQETGNKVFSETMAGLLNLGYQEEEVRPILKEILVINTDFDVTEAIRATLKQMAKNKG